MATIQKYDELNAYDSTLTTEEVEEFNYKKYFGEMLISDEEKAKREELAEKLEPIFALLFLMVVSGDSVDDCLDYFTSRYKVIAKDYLGTKNIPAYVGDHANAFGTEIIDATERNQDKDYFSSLDRAKRVAADEANTLGEYSAYADAIKRGCTKKRWHIISDKRTRHTHRVLSEKTIGIYKDFDVGGYKMRFPKDTLYSPDVGEIANCRCSVEYLGGNKQGGSLTQNVDNSKLGTLFTSEGNQGVHTIGKLNRDIYKCVSEDITTDEVIITDERIQHVKERHPNDYETYYKYMKEIVESPDYIIETNKPNTALILKEISYANGKKFKTVIRLKTSTDKPQYKNSIITFMKIDEREWNRLIKNKVVLYKVSR